jgi:hypothetical protein
MKTKTKLKINSKKYKTYKRKYNKRYLNTLKGGAAAAASKISIPSITELIYNSNTVNVIINYNNVVLKCVIGKNNISIGNGNLKESCIIINYFNEENYCMLESFFYKKPKNTCIGKEPIKSINNTIFKQHITSEGIVPEDYNKQLNETLFNLIDIININANIKYCRLVDASTLFVKKCSDIPINYLKHIERGYGFYNEFGYIYTDSDIPKAIPDVVYEDLISNSNSILQSIILSIRNKTLLELNQDLPQIEIPENVIKIQNNLVKNLVIEIMKFCKTEATSLDSGILTSFTTKDIIELLEIIIEHLIFLLPNNIRNQIKLYNSEEKTKSALTNKDNDAQRAFAMVPIENQQNIQISEINLPGFKYQIDIT